MSCFGNRQRRGGLAPWRLCLTILTIISSTGFCRSTADSLSPDTFSSSSSSSSSSSTSPRKILDQEIGSPSELAWQAWLLVENKHGGQSALDSSNILRRITPKSIFIAPELISCPNGFSSDGKGVCKPDPIKIDEEAQRQFFLKRLNNLYGKLGNNRKKPDAAGPLQINIPISLPSKGNPPEPQPVQPQPVQEAQQPTQKVDQVTVSDDRLAIPVVISQQTPVQLDSDKNQGAVAVVVYKVTNDTKKDQKQPADEEKISFFLGNASSSSLPKKDATPIGQVVPVAEIVDEMNDTFSGIVDYKIPISLKFNGSDIFDQKKIGEKKLDSTDSTEDSSPTVVLLLSPTKLPFVTSTRKETESSKSESYDQSSVHQESTQNDGTTIQSTEGEMKYESDSTIQTVAPLDMQTAVGSTDNTPKSTEKTYTQSRLEDETAYTDGETIQTEQESDDHDDYDDTTDGVEQDEFGESEDELLKPGEAGMMIPSKNQDLIRSKNHKQQHMSTTVDVDDPTSTTFIDTTTPPAFSTVDMQDSFDTADSTIKTDATEYTRAEDTMTTQTTDIPSTMITTEPSIDETTIYTTRPVRVKTTLRDTRVSPTQAPVTITTSTENKDTADTKEFLDIEGDLITEPEVIYSTKGSHSITTAYGRKKPTHPSKIMDTPYTLGDLEDVISRTEPPSSSDFHRRNPSDHRRLKPSITVNNEPIFFKNDGNIPSEFKDQLAESSGPFTMDFRRIPSSQHSVNDEPPSFIRFPEQSPETRLQHSFVRFPSDEVNSIHNQDSYKDHLISPYHSRDEYNGNSASSSTKSSVPARQKSPSTHWRVPPPPGIRMDRQHQQSQQIQTSSSTSNQRQQKQKPMLLRFWARMPLVRDLSFYPTTSHGSHNEPIGGQDESHRLNSRFSPVTIQSARRVNYYKEMSSHDVNRLLAQQLGQPSIGG